MSNEYRTLVLCLPWSRHRWIPRTKASDVELWCFLWHASEQTVDQTIETPVIWDAIAPIMTSLWCSTGLSKLEILAQGFLFFLAGYDTVSDALALLLYCLAIYPDIQERAQEEVDAAFGEKVGQRTRTLQWGLHICVIKSPTTPLFFQKLLKLIRKYQSPELLAFSEGNPTTTSGFPSQRAIHDRGFPWHDGIMWWRFSGGPEGIGIQIWWPHYFSLTILTSKIKKKKICSSGVRFEFTLSAS